MAIRWQWLSWAGGMSMGLTWTKMRPKPSFGTKKPPLLAVRLGVITWQKCILTVGVEKDPARGYAWLVLSAQKGNPIAKAEADAYKAKLSAQEQIRCDQVLKQLEADPNS